MEQTFCEHSGVPLATNRTIIIESAALAEAMDIPSLTPFVEITVSPSNTVLSVKIVEDVMHLYNDNNAFKREVDEAIK